MTWEIFFGNLPSIAASAFMLLAFIISPVVLLRWLRTRNELLEIQTFIKKSSVIREEITKLNEEVGALAARIRTLELELHSEKLNGLNLKAEIVTLTKERDAALEQLHTIQKSR